MLFYSSYSTIHKVIYKILKLYVISYSKWVNIGSYLSIGSGTQLDVADDALG